MYKCVSLVCICKKNDQVENQANIQTQRTKQPKLVQNQLESQCLWIQSINYLLYIYTLLPIKMCFITEINGYIDK